MSGWTGWELEGEKTPLSPGYGHALAKATRSEGALFLLRSMPDKVPHFQAQFHRNKSSHKF